MGNLPDTRTLNASPDFAALINSLNPGIEYLNREFHRAGYGYYSFCYFPENKID
jgi:hypothetical protein